MALNTPIFGVGLNELRLPGIYYRGVPKPKVEPPEADRATLGELVLLAASGPVDMEVRVRALLTTGAGRILPLGLSGGGMVEGFRTAAAFLRRRGEGLGLTRERLRGFDVGVSVEADWVVQVDAGLGIGLAAVAALKGAPLRADAAVTGRMDEDGRIRPVGGAERMVLKALARDRRRLVLPAAVLEMRPGLVKEFDRRIELVPVSGFEQAFAAVALPGSGFAMVEDG